jgi:RNA polymerase sigma factor (sigma-70 family)
MADLPMSTEELIRACVQGQRGAWEEFILRYDRLIVGVVIRTSDYWGADSDESIKDMVQEVYAKLCEDQCRLLKEFEFRHEGSIYGYLKAIAANEVHDRLRHLHSERRGSGQAGTSLELLQNQPIADRDGSQAAIEQQLLFNEIDDLLQTHLPESTQERDRTIFWLRHRQGLAAREIASQPSINLTAKGVESTLRRLEQLLRTALAERPGEQRLASSGDRPEKDWAR